MKNTVRQKILPFFAVFLFSLCVVIISEYIQRDSIAEVIAFAEKKTAVIVYCALVTALFTVSAIWLTHSAAAGSLICGTLIYILSIIEYFKFDISGSHLLAADFEFSANVGEISRFADLRITPHLVISAVGMILCAVLMCFVKVPRPRVGARGIALSLACFMFGGLLISPSGAAYENFGFDENVALTVPDMNKRFENDGFLGFFLKNTTENIDFKITPPSGYSEEYMEKLVPAEGGRKEGKHPNVVIIASESFADLRVINDKKTYGTFYEGFDRAAELGTSGMCVAPTFGGYTVRSEFELLFGLPALSMANVPSPHSMLDSEKKQDTIVRIFKDQGYKTTYIHPFYGEFYERNTVYKSYGFDSMLFADSFSGAETYRRYVSDGAVMEKIKSELSEGDNPAFIFAMTMQNHQPYTDSENSDELSYYLDGIKKSGDELYKFLKWLEEFDEETVVLFVGDHYPFFTPRGGVYKALCEDEDVENKLYTQRYLVYSNREKIELEGGEVSLFYLPHLLISKSGIPYGSFVAFMLERERKTPVYSAVYYDGKRNVPLDAVTYDRTLGFRYTCGRGEERR